MGRPREFDEDEAIAAAKRTFWRLGYEATSMPDLLDATGLSRGSLYKAFGSKHALYLRSLEHYLAEGRRGLARTLNEDPSVKRGIRSWLSAIIERSTGSGPRCGCFAVNSAVELGPHDDDVRAMLRAHERAYEEIVASAIRRGVASGELGKHVDPEAIAKTLRLLISGLQVGSKSSLTRAEAKQTVATVLRLLD